MPSQLAMPIPVAPGRSSVFSSQDLYASLNNSLASKSAMSVSYSIQDRDYTVPAPPPPSPVSFRVHPDQRPKPPRS
ncbi:hypothetical protein MAPG_05482 [Magnaporthiopsis poae ATCC 64411]|uniref:Uncharacterized protein n=1 Tax=Magnaporthiopsis poae (strain ATCC 64411 / 73-15) TaxID=644358 RepID=A0A0C4DZI1_MAGP6|nr:hypothetical protein MAPG_05482 [Magnaporthiopsis poae ATCC 64411]